MSCKHAPGPWRHGYPDVFQVGSAAGRRVCSLPHSVSPEQEANANLIAAAPDLLEAANRALDLMDRFMDGGAVTNGEWDDAYERLHDAARRAEGRSA